MDDALVPDEITLTELRARLDDALATVTAVGARIYITDDDGRRIAALVPPDEAEWLDEREDAHDLRMVREAMEQDPTGARRIPLAEVLAQLAAEGHDLGEPGEGVSASGAERKPAASGTESGGS